MFPSAEEASDTQFAEGAVVTVQFWATDGSVGREKLIRAATVKNIGRGAVAANADQRFVSSLLTAASV